MRIRHYLYNAFIVESDGVKIAIDPGRNLLCYKLNSLIPKSEWQGVTHILLTHGDPDHFAYAIPMAKKTGARVVCGEEVEEDFLLNEIRPVQTLGVGEVVDLKDFVVEGLKTKHGPLSVRLLAGLIELKATRNVRGHGTVKLLFGLVKLEKDNIDFARGSIGFKITIGDKTVVNLGDTVTQKGWEGLRPDVLMVPIGGKVIKNTTDEKEALEVVKLVSPKKVVPTHYNCPALWQKNINPADDDMFKNEVEKLGRQCILMKYGDEIVV